MCIRDRCPDSSHQNVVAGITRCYSANLYGTENRIGFNLLDYSIDYIGIEPSGENREWEDGLS